MRAFKSLIYRLNKKIYDFFACVISLKKSIFSLFIMGWLREPTATGNLLCQTAGVSILNDHKVASGAPPLSSSYLAHRRLCSLPSIYPLIFHCYHFEQYVPYVLDNDIKLKRDWIHFLFRIAFKPSTISLTFFFSCGVKSKVRVFSKIFRASLYWS